MEFEAVSDFLKCVEKENLFANFPIGATIQDGGKRKRSVDGGHIDLFGHVPFHHPRNKSKIK